MKVSRAGFLKMCGAVLLGRPVDASSWSTAIDGALAAQAPARIRAPFRVEDARASLFQPHLQTRFAVRSTEGTRLPLVLTRVTERPLAHNVEQFSLSFHAPPGAALPPGTHAFQHPALGNFNLFIAPVGGGNVQHPEYEACFSRHISDVRRTVSHAHRAVSDGEGSTRARNARAAEGGNNTCQIRS